MGIHPRLDPCTTDARRCIAMNDAWTYVVKRGDACEGTKEGGGDESGTKVGARGAWSG
jgi:hypothetical protein